MMELNEDVEGAVREDQLIQMKEENARTQSHLQQQIAEAFNRQDFDRCKSLLIQLKFYRSIEQSIKQKLP